MVKSNAKRTLEKYFKRDEGSILFFLRWEKKQNTTRCEERIALNINSSEELCFIR
jgi:hypothetical protein